METPPKQKKAKKQAGRWSAEEHQLFMLGIFQHGKDWNKVEQVVGTRSGSQVRSHAQKFFNRLQKERKTQNSGEPHRQIQMSETENDFLKGIVQEEASLNTPFEIVSLIRKQSREDKTVNVNNLIKKLQIEDKHVQQKQEKIQKPVEKEEGNAPSQLQQRNSFKSMTNILSAYENVNEDKKPLQNEDQSFLLLLTKKYKKYFAHGGQFENLIDFGNANEVIAAQQSIRKRSFRLLEGEESDEEKLETIKKQIKADTKDQSPSQVLKKEQQSSKKGEGQEQAVPEMQNGSKIRTPIKEEIRIDKN